MRLPKIVALLLVLAAVAAASITLAATPLRTETAPVQVIFPEGTVLHVTNFSALARFTVAPPGAQFVGGFHADHSMWIMAWTNGTPLPMCPIALGYVGPPMNASYNETLKPATYTFSEVCGGLGNVTVTQTLELVYPDAANGTAAGAEGAGSGGAVGGSGGAAGGTGYPPVSPVPVLLILPATVLLFAAAVALVRRKPSRRPPNPPPPAP